jgi:phosphohistidine phosphatase
MLTLYLLRHAKSSWDQPELSDSERPLSPRGRDAAPLVGRYMRSQGYVPDLILCSPAVRARQTLELAVSTTDARIIDGLYNFGDGTGLIHIIAREGGTSASVLVIGHNPSIAGAAALLVGKGASADHNRMARKYPTAGLAVIQFDLNSWSKIAAGKGRLARFVRPRDVVKG